MCKDATKYNIQILGIAKTDYQTGEIESITIKDKNNKPKNYQIYHGGTDNYVYTGVGIIIEMNGNTKPTYQKITNQIIKAGIQVDKALHMNVIVAYAPTFVGSEACPNDRDDFYEALEEPIRPHEENKHMLMVIGDFNAKTGSAYPQYEDEIGIYGKGSVISNGDTLLQLVKEKKLILTYTLFDHKLAH